MIQAADASTQAAVQTLDALQYLMGICATKASNVRRRVVLDAERYRARHQEIL